MSESWTDPGSLEGEALRQWYLRSPADIERARQEAAARRYQDFFYGGASAGADPDSPVGRDVSASAQGIDRDPATSAPSVATDIDPGFTWVADGPNRWRSVRTDESGQSLGPSSYGLGLYGSPMARPILQDRSAVGPSPQPPADAGRGYVQLAAASPGFWDYVTPGGCANCHGYTPGTLPPTGGHSPFPPSYSPRRGDASGYGGSPKRRLPQCDVQYENDTERCNALPKPDARARCWASASERRAYCLSHDGEVGWPKLQTR